MVDDGDVSSRQIRSPRSWWQRVGIKLQANSQVGLVLRKRVQQHREHLLPFHRGHIGEHDRGAHAGRPRRPSAGEVRPAPPLVLLQAHILQRLAGRHQVGLGVLVAALVREVLFGVRPSCQKSVDDRGDAGANERTVVRLVEHWVDGVGVGVRSHEPGYPVRVAGIAKASRLLTLRGNVSGDTLDHRLQKWMPRPRHDGERGKLWTMITTARPAE
mmetsp:Transcript_22098/g.61929  ORF Transcript_22098/g.61929 Transcript_22098/m.61929 type:complete len:215 (-) Transcript_22098:627-1271(-)